MRTGQAVLPLHYGKAPPWLFEKMSSLAGEICRVIVSEFGTQELLSRLADPFWFQAFGCLLGFDWHSSGLTTTVTAAMKEGLKPIQNELGFFIAGGKGKTALKTPAEIETIGSQCGLKQTEKLIRVSRLTARVDNNAIQDSFQLYHHCIFFDKKGNWAVVQQGMLAEQRQARRYHWLSFSCQSFVLEPHNAIITSVKKEKVLNLTDKNSLEAQNAIVHLAKEKPNKVGKILKRFLELPARHSVELKDIDPAKIEKTLLHTYYQPPADFTALIETPKIGAKTLRALALTAELIYGTPLSWQDPARYSFAHGGKDGHPYPVNRRTYQNTIEFLKECTEKTSLSGKQKTEALRKLELFYQK